MMLKLTPSCQNQRNCQSAIQVIPTITKPIKTLGLLCLKLRQKEKRNYHYSQHYLSLFGPRGQQLLSNDVSFQI